MHSPSGGEPEWVELYNAGPDSVDIKSWTICNKNRVHYSLRNSDQYIPAYSYLVLTNSNTFADFHPEAAGSYIIVNWSQYFLVNAGDTVALHDSFGRLVDSVYYTSSWGGAGGKSLERKSAADSSRSKSNWGTSKDPHGSTPARLNSISSRRFDLSISSFSAEYFAGESKAVFDILVKNTGSEPAPSFSVNVYLDLNADSLAQSGEFVAGRSGIDLNSGDSIRFHLEKETANSNCPLAIAILDFAPDEDTTNNKIIAAVNRSYSKGSVVVNEIMYAPVSPQPEGSGALLPSIRRREDTIA